MGSETTPVSLGLDIGGTKIKAVALSGQTTILEEAVFPSHASEGPEAVRTAIKECVSHFRTKKLVFGSIGVGCAGSVDNRAGIVRNSPNFSQWRDVPLKTWVESDFGVRAQVENDAKCAVLAEWRMGAGRGFHNIVLLTLGTGIGGGLILDGHLYRGSTGTAGELGHLSIHANGIPCPCGNTGCFERYCSATAVKLMSGGISSKEVFSRASENLVYAKIVEQFLANFQVGLTSIANTFDPDCILLGGAVSEGVAVHLSKITEWVRTHCFPAVGQRLVIKTTQHGNLSGALGAAHLCF